MTSFQIMVLAIAVGFFAIAFMAWRGQRGNCPAPVELATVATTSTRGRYNKPVRFVIAVRAYSRISKLRMARSRRNATTALILLKESPNVNRRELAELIGRSASRSQNPDSVLSLGYNILRELIDHKIIEEAQP